MALLLTLGTQWVGSLPLTERLASAFSKKSTILARFSTSASNPSILSETTALCTFFWSERGTMNDGQGTTPIMLFKTGRFHVKVTYIIWEELIEQAIQGNIGTIIIRYPIHHDAKAL